MKEWGAHGLPARCPTHIISCSWPCWLELMRVTHKQHLGGHRFPTPALEVTNALWKIKSLSTFDTFASQLNYYTKFSVAGAISPSA